MLIAGIIVIVIGAGLFWLSNKQKLTSQAMSKTKAVPIDQLQSNTQAEVQGTVEADHPLQTPFSKRDCVYYEYDVEKEVRRRNQQGQIETDWENVEGDKKRTSFKITDSTGEVAVNPDKATIEPEDLGEQRYRRGDRFDNDILGSIINAVSDSNVRVTERALLTGNNGYVFGFVDEGAHGLEFKKGSQDFLISHKTEEQVQKSTARSATAMKVFGIIGFVVGVVLIVMSFTG